MLAIAPARLPLVRVQRSATVGGGAAVAGTTSSLVGGGIAIYGAYLMIFGSPVWQPIGIALGFFGMLIGVGLERSGY
jgi:hypothetical protein